MKQTTMLGIQGMSCNHCVKGVEKALKSVPGVEVSHVEIGSAEVVLDPDQIDRESLESALQEVGFELRRPIRVRGSGKNKNEG